MIKKLFLTVLAIVALFAPHSLSAQESAEFTMYVWQKDGEHAKFVYSNIDNIGFYLPEPEFVDGSLTFSDITETSATCSGTVSGYFLTYYGICYSMDKVNAEHIPANSISPTGGDFSINLTDLAPNTTYYVRAYATNATGTYYGSEQTFTTEAAQPTCEGGKLPGKFSVSATKQVQFSQGNLQYQASTSTWRFAERQWDFVDEGKRGEDSSEANKVTGTIEGSNNSSIGQADYQGWIDLFGWGTGNNPTQSSTNSRDYATFTDWGTNAITNGGNRPDMWRTLTNDEWYYLRYTRTDADKKYGVAKVNGVTGLIFLPDEWTQPENITFNPGVDEYSDWVGYQNRNTYTAEEWQLMENAGAVFMPAAGYRFGSDVSRVGLYGYYWSSTESGADGAYYLSFNSGNLSTSGSYRCSGLSVRLVSEFQATE